MPTPTSGDSAIILDATSPYRFRFHISVANAEMPSTDSVGIIPRSRLKPLTAADEGADATAIATARTSAADPPTTHARARRTRSAPTAPHQMNSSATAAVPTAVRDPDAQMATHDTARAASPPTIAHRRRDHTAAANSAAPHIALTTPNGLASTIVPVARPM